MEELRESGGSLDDPRRWGDAGIWERPGYDAERFQKRLNRVMGLSVSGQPIVRLVWAWDEQQYEAGEIRQKYRYYAEEVREGAGAGRIVDISPPRWILEERQEPGQYREGWERLRYVRVPDEWSVSGYQVIDALGEAPADGWYVALWVIAEHEEGNGCCKRSKGKCWGKYREPGEIDLEILREAKKKRDETEYRQSPHEPLSTETVARAMLEGRAANEAESIGKKKQLYDLWLNHAEMWGWQIGETNEKRLRHGRWHVMPGQMKETASGLVVPDNN